MNSPLVSIIVPTYNVERYIEECMDSLLAQTYQNIEYIIIDDASTDATPYLLKQYENKVTLLLNRKNQGQGAVRNQGLNQANGAYVLFVDSDDWIEPETVAYLIQAVRQSVVDIVRFNGKSFSDNGKVTQKEGNYNFSSILKENILYTDADLLKVNQKAYSASPCLYMVKKELLEKNRIKFPEGILHEDEYFTTMVFTYSKQMKFVNRAFYHRRYRVASTMTEITPLHKIKSFESYLEIFKKLEFEYKRQQLDDTQRSFIKRQMISIYYGLQNSPIDAKYKKQLRKLRTITMKDKARILMSRIRSARKSNNV